jgi:2-dehydro-3-deoxyphosphogluconate aldolase/(4S)-4-hydroxy-2-oxoglutarate aldolase
MARYRRLDTLVTIRDTGIIPLFYHHDLSTAQGIVSACVKGGACAVEFTNRGDFAADLFGELELFAKKELPSLILGAGSVVDAPTAALYISRGANFIVGPCFSEEVARLCNIRRIPYMPGCMTLTEIQTAAEYGCEIIKIFPGETAGPSFIKAVKGPLPHASLMPTGGVFPTRESLCEWFAAGASCVGLGSQLITKDLVEKKDFSSLEKKVAECAVWVKELRK